MVGPLTGRAPVLRVIERGSVRQHGDALTALCVCGEKCLGEPHALAAKDEKVAVLVAGLRVGAARLLGEEVQTRVTCDKSVLFGKVRPALVYRHVEALPVAKSRAMQALLVK